MADHRVGPSTLLDIPDAGFQAVLHHLASRDHASLRQVSHSMATMVTQHILYLTMRLSASSSTDQLHQWSQATQRLGYTTCVHIVVSGDVPQEILELAIQLLSQRRQQITELQLLGLAAEMTDTDSSSYGNLAAASGTHLPFLASIACLKHLLVSLRVLVIKGIAVHDMASDLQDIARDVLGKQQLQTLDLRSLTLEAEWKSDKGRRNSTGKQQTDPCAVYLALSQLTAAMSRLVELSITIPPLYWLCRMAAKDHANAAAGATASRLAAFRSKMVNSGCDDLSEAGAALLLAVVTATSALQQLRALTITGPFAVRLPASLPRDLLPAPLAATAGSDTQYDTIDELGCWLLRNHPRLVHLQISSNLHSLSCLWTAPKKPVPQLLLSHVELQTSLSTPVRFLHVVKRPENAHFWNSSIITLQRQVVTENLEGVLQPSWSPFPSHHLSWISSRPTQHLMCHISSCQMTLSAYEKNAAGLLCEMKSLRHLQVVLLCYHLEDDLQRTSNPAEATQAVVEAAAQLQRLQSLILTFKTEQQQSIEVPANLLLPLTAAAGGPGTGLKKLKILGNLTVGAASVAAVDTPTCQWHETLRELRGLHELTIIHEGRNQPQIDFPVKHLPPELEVFEGSRLNMILNSESVLSTVSSISNHQVMGEPFGSPRLRVLRLHHCQMDTPSILASRQLQQLVVTDSSWSGGWSIAAAAWPALQQLSWVYDSRLTSYHRASNNSITAGSVYTEAFVTVPSNAVRQALQEIASGFMHLQTLTVFQLPPGAMSVEVLQPVVQLIIMANSMRRISLTVTLPPASPAQNEVHEPVVKEDSDNFVERWLCQQLPWADVSLKV